MMLQGGVRMTTEMTIHESAEAVEIKIQVLAWIGIMPEPYSTMHALEIKIMRHGLADENCPEKERKMIEEAIPHLNKTMNDGINIVMRKLNTDDCIECGKCNNLSETLQMLLDEKPNDVINSKIKEHFGDITTAKGVGMPGHQSDGPGIRVLEVGSGNGPESLLQMLEMIAKSGSPDDFAVLTHKAESQNPIKSLLNAISSIGKPDKDKMH